MLLLLCFFFCFVAELFGTDTKVLQLVDGDDIGGIGSAEREVYDGYMIISSVISGATITTATITITTIIAITIIIIIEILYGFF